MTKELLLFLISLFLSLAVIHSAYMHIKHWSSNKNPLSEKILYTSLFIFLFLVYISFVIIRGFISILLKVFDFISMFYGFFPVFVSSVLFIGLMYELTLGTRLVYILEPTIDTVGVIIVFIILLALLIPVSIFILFLLLFPTALLSIIFQHLIYPMVSYIEKKTSKLMLSLHTSAFYTKSPYKEKKEYKKGETSNNYKKSVVVDENKKQYDSYCSLLGVSPNSNHQEIRKAYHRKISKFHPDINSAKDAVEKTTEINIAKDFIDRHIGKYGG